MALKSITFLGKKIFTKQDILIDLIKGKSVVHYGCIDDTLEIIKGKRNKGYYLHELVTKNATKCIGVDINEELMKTLNEEFGIKNIVYGDVENPETFKMDIKRLAEYEVLLIPDLIEHLNNVGNMLVGIKNNFSPQVRILIGTPNPCGYINFLATLLRKEVYSNYHSCLFTSECMKIILKRHGIVINRVYPVYVPKEQNKTMVFIDKIISRIFTWISPGFADLYLYDCQMSDDLK